MKKNIALLFLSTLGFSSAFSQISTPQNAGEIIQSLKKLNTLGSVLYVAAHPDDENTRLLAYLASEKKVRTAYLSLTRGDGGQNLIGKEQGEPLGLIRTQELLAARRTDGAEQFFTRANDFGYSKNPEETFSIWNKDSILSDVVFAIRRFKPDVIICRFPTTGEGGHGHHTASAILALEAFDAAADPRRFPQQLKYTQVWQARRIYWNTFNFGGTNTTSPSQLHTDIGVFNPLLGKGYGEVASESRSMHKSQGFGSARQRGSGMEYFKLLKGDSVQDDVLKGIDLSWSKLKAGSKIQKSIEKCIQTFDPQAPENSVKSLVTIYREIQALPEDDATVAYWKRKKLKETEGLILSCSGLFIEALASDYTGIPGKDVTLTAQIVNRNSGMVKLNTVSFLQTSDTSTNLSLKTNELYSFKRKLQLPDTTPFSNPYWLNQQHGIGLYTVSNPLLIGRPENDPFAKIMFTVTVQDLELKITRDVVYKYTDPVKGEIYRPFEILPAATINLSEKVVLLNGDSPAVVQFVIKANADNVDILMQLGFGKDNVSYVLDNKQFKLQNKGDQAIATATITPSGSYAGGIMQVYMFVNGSNISKSIRRIEYDHIPYQFILSEAEATVVRLDLKKTGLNIGYIQGAGDEIPASLKQVGYSVTLLTDEQLSTGNLSAYNAIVTGVRAYNTNDRLQTHYSKLMDYVSNGGNLIVQYNTNNRIGPVLANIGPYPFTITRDRVTDEKAEMRFKNKDHSVLNFPNHLTAEDFEGWVQERGIYFATELNSHYETIFSVNDPGEKAMEGSLIIAKHCKGNFVYTGLAFFRELPAGVPGAYRLFANLLSLPQNK